MRNEKGQFIKGHIVPEDYKIKSSLANKGKPNIKNSLRKRTKSELEQLKKQGFKKGQTAWNKGIGSKEYKCCVCHKEFIDKKYRRHKYCSKECRDKSNGETHWRYKGNEPRGSQTKRNWKIYKEFKKSIHSRDKKCLACGSYQNLIAHHIKSWKENEKLRFDVNNGITLCNNCHNNLHKECGRNKIDYEKQEKWLKKNLKINN